MAEDSENDTHVLTEIERLERDKSIMAGEIRRLARDLIDVASQLPAAFTNDTERRVRYARAMLTKHKKARR